MNEKPQPGTLRTISTDSSSGELYGRFLFGLGNIRSCVYRQENERLAYDESLHGVFQNLAEMQLAREKCLRLMTTHEERISSGDDGKFHGQQIDVREPIDDELNLLFKDFFIRGIIAIDGLIAHANFIGFKIGFLFSEDEKKFRKGLKRFPLEENDERFSALNNFISNHKSAWYTTFREMRRRIEHEGWSLPVLIYRIDNNSVVHVVFPTLDEFALEDLMDVCWNNILNLCEEVTVFLLGMKLKDDLMIVKLPEEKRAEQMGARYMASHRSMPGVRLQC